MNVQLLEWATNPAILNADIVSVISMASDPLLNRFQQSAGITLVKAFG